ncbi:hypothetical protein [Arthrobacter castelli]|uniref:hypothetical protein n=1 Tax=Arthrobacter castelli TaxID=271431 RepID=UPI0012DC6034|nr:hypothetical protein [Arthrobacter castelli]
MKIGQDLSARTNLQWWAASVDRTNQRGYLRGKDAGFHTSTALIDKSFAALKSGGAWWVCPGDALTTSRGPIQGSPSVISAAPDDHWLKDDKHTLWSVRVDPEATVYEVHQRSDWVRLLQQYPYEASNIVTFDWAEDVPVGSRLLIPDWSEVARDWDGVHVSVAGYLNAAYTPLMLDTARYGLLTGWHPDATVWLTEKARTLLPAS